MEIDGNGDDGYLHIFTGKLAFAQKLLYTESESCPATWWQAVGWVTFRTFKILKKTIIIISQNSIGWVDNVKEQKSCSLGAAWEQPSRGVMTPPRWVWATAAIDRWPGRLFTVKAPSIALLHYVTFNRALADWNSAPPRCTFRTLPPSLRTSCPCACICARARTDTHSHYVNCQFQKNTHKRREGKKSHPATKLHLFMYNYVLLCNNYHHYYFLQRFD